MKKNQFLAFLCSTASVGLVILAIDTLACATNEMCQQSNQSFLNVAQASDVTVNIPTLYNNWSGSSQPNFSMEFPSNSASYTPPYTNSDGDDSC